MERSWWVGGVGGLRWGARGKGRLREQDCGTANHTEGKEKKTEKKTKGGGDVEEDRFEIWVFN